MVAVHYVAEVGFDFGELVHAETEDPRLLLKRMRDLLMEAVAVLFPLDDEYFGVVVESRSRDAGGDVYHLAKLPSAA